MNDTLVKFGYPHSIVKSYQNWSVLLRPDQVTLGSLILASHSEAHAFSDLTEPAMREFSSIIKDIESCLSNCFDYDKINYLMLMMIDPHVHFHVIPRYSCARKFQSLTLEDQDWPGPPNLAGKLDLNTSQKQNLLNYLKDKWIKEPGT